MKHSFENEPKQKKESGELELKIVGGAEEKLKEQVQEQARYFLGEGHLSNFPPKEIEMIKNREIAKTPEQLELAGWANEKTSELMEWAGVSSHEFPDKNIHIVPKEIYGKLNPAAPDNPAFGSPEIQAVFFNEPFTKNNDYFFGLSLVHELAHMKNFMSLEASQIGDKGCISVRRFGLAVFSSQKTNKEGFPHEHFRGLTEAVIAKLEKKYAGELLDIPMFDDDRERICSKEGQEIKKNLALKNNIPEDEILWFGETGKPRVDAGYPRQREVLDFVCGEILKELPEEHKDVEKISDEFLKSLFTGRLLAIAGPVEKTFGKGSFRVLGMMGDDKNSAINALETLKSMRRAQLKNAN